MSLPDCFLVRQNIDAGFSCLFVCTIFIYSYFFTVLSAPADPKSSGLTEKPLPDIHYRYVFKS
jgi:hypothetical protein